MTNRIRKASGRFKVWFALAFALMLVPGLAAAQCRQDTIELRGDWGQARFSVEIADTPELRSLGLMHREYLPRGSGMLFLYSMPQSVSFWMRNTLIPLDMIFIDDSGTVRRVHHEAQPLDETLIHGGDEILSVLEINGGLSHMLGIDAGTEIRHPRMPQDSAAWPCEE